MERRNFIQKVGAGVGPLFAMGLGVFNLSARESSGQIIDPKQLKIVPTRLVKPRNPLPKYGFKFSGLNMALVLPLSEEEHRNRIANNIIVSTKQFTVYLYGENNVKIPVKVKEGNNGTWYDKDFGYGEKTCCFFGYISPLEFDTHNQGKFWLGNKE